MRDCEEIQELFTDALDGTLDESAMSELMSHLEGCTVCRRLFDDMKFIMQETASLSVEPPEDLHERITNAVKWQARIDAMQKRNRRHGLVAAACAVLILAGAGIASMTGMGRKSKDSAMAEETKFYAAAGLDSRNLMESENPAAETESEICDESADAPQSEAQAAEIKADIKDEAALKRIARSIVMLDDGKTAYLISQDDFDPLVTAGSIANPELVSDCRPEIGGEILIIARN